MPVYKIKLLEAYELEMEVEMPTAELAKQEASFLTEDILREACAAKNIEVKLAWQQFKACTTQDISPQHKYRKKRAKKAGGST